MVQITDKAHEALKGIMEERKLDSPIRIFMAQGCGGAALQMALDEPQTGDETYDLNGITAIIDRGLLAQAGEVSIDYVEAGMRSGFMISSKEPLKVEGGDGCGCGCSC